MLGFARPISAWSQPEATYQPQQVKGCQWHGLQAMAILLSWGCSCATQATLSVTLPTTTFTNLAGNPTPAIAGAPDVTSGTVSAANGLPPTGTVQV